MVATRLQFQFEGSPSPTSEPQQLTNPAGSKRLRILFLGNSYNPMGTVCLQALVELGHEAIVGDYDPLTQGGWRFARKKLRSHGWRLVLKRTSYLIRCKTRIALRRMGVPLSGFASLPELTRACGLNVIQSANPNSAEFVQQVRQLGVQLIVVANFSRILKRALIETPGLGCINVHPSLLPRYRGPEPFYWVLANREKTTGVTLHYMDEGIDSGDIILQRELEIRPKETESTLLHRSAAMAAELLREAIPLVQAGCAPRIPQDQTAATYYSFP